MAESRTSRTKKKTVDLNKVNAFTQAMSEKDEIQRSQLEQGFRTELPLSKIKLRDQDTRPLQQKHVGELAESIAALGLIEPLVVDREGVLLAGNHRLAAIKLLSEAKLEEYEPAFEENFPNSTVPVRMMPFSSKIEPERAFQIEVAENEKRRNYNKEEVAKFADRLKSLGYQDSVGRPASGSKALGPALSVIIGVSSRHVRRILNAQNNQGKSKTKKYIDILKRLNKNIQDLIEIGELDDALKVDNMLVKALPNFHSKVENCLYARRQVD